MLLELPLHNTSANQRVSFYVNNQTITLDIFITQTQDGEFLFANFYFGAELIIAGARCIHAQYLNAFISDFNGYLFFYCSDGLDPTYEKLGTIAKLYYADYDILAGVETQYIQDNLAYFQSRFGV